MPPSPLVAIETVTKRFGATAAVDGVSLAIEPGEFFALLGPSGCGKTTLLRMLAGFETPDGGTISIGGRDMAGVPPHRRPVNMMFQSYALFPHMTVGQNIAFGLKQDGLGRDEIERRVKAMLDLVQMPDMARRRPAELSGGQRQRVALARALAKEPLLLLLDEPLAALDRKLREQTQFELAALQKRVGITFVVVTHDQEEALAMATRLAVMDRGKVRQVGTPEDVYETPASRFVADFIGAANIFEGRVVGASGGMVEIFSDEAGGRLLVPGTVADGTAALAIRPEKIALGDAAVNRLTGTVRDIGYVGRSSVLNVALPSGKSVRIALPNASRTDRIGASSGDTVTLSWAPQNGVLLG